MMTRVKKLLAEVSSEQKIDLKILANVAASAKKECAAHPTNANRKAWKEAEAALAEECDRIEAAAAATSPTSLNWSDYADTANKAEVLRHLQGMGYQISQRTFYRHCKRGKLHKNTDGVYSRRLVKQYVKEAGLYRPGREPDSGGNPEDLAAEKLQAEVEKLKASGARERLKLERERGRLIERDLLYPELAARAVTLDTGFRQMVHVEASMLIQLVGGNLNRQTEFVDYLLQAWNELMNGYASTDEFEVFFIQDKEEEEG